MKAQTDEEILKEAHERFDESKRAWSPIFDRFRDDMAFLHGDMWDDRVKRLREEEGLSCLNVDKTSPKIATITANMRSNMPGIKVHAVDSGASENTAKVFDGVIRSIEYQSGAKQARINGYQSSVSGGIGAWRIVAVPNDEDEVDLEYRRILDPTSVMVDPSAKSATFDDAEFGFVVTWEAKKGFKEDYPDVDPDAFDSTYKSWCNEDKVQVVEYWRRNAKTQRFEYFLICGEHILKRNVRYPGKFLPIMFLTGKEYCIGSERDYFGVVRNARDSQILHNLVKARAADYVARSAEPQWLAEDEQIADHKEWDKPNVSGSPILTYTGTSSGGKPQRIDPLTPPTGLIEMGKESDEDIRAIIGIREPTQDVPSTQSGKAIALQISQGNIGTFEFADKLNDMVKYEGRVLVDLIPHFYSYAHIRAILGLDGKVTTIPLNQTYMDNGEEVMHDLSRGKYMVTITTGPSYDSQRAEATDRMIELVGKYPDIMPVAGDLIVAGMDFRGAEELADRLKASIPPNILAASNPTNGDKAQQTIAQLTAQIQGMGQQLEQMNQQGQQLAQENQALKQEQACKSQEIQLKAQVDSEITQGKYGLDMQLLQFKQQHEERMELLKQQHERDMAVLSLKGAAATGEAELGIKGRQALEQIAAKGDVEAQILEVQHSHATQSQGIDAATKVKLQDDAQAHQIDMAELSAQIEFAMHAAETPAQERAEHG